MLEADLDGDEVLEEDIVNVRVVQVKELFQLGGLGILCKIKETVEAIPELSVLTQHLKNICSVLCVGNWAMENKFKFVIECISVANQGFIAERWDHCSFQLRFPSQR